MALTPQQIDRIATSYVALEPALDDLVENFYQRLFTTAPDVRSMFPEDMSGQRKHLAGALRLVAQHIQNIENLAQPLREMGARHVGYGAQEAHYPVVRDTLLASMGELAGPIWTEELQQDWTDALNAIAGYMIEGANGVQQQAA